MSRSLVSLLLVLVLVSGCGRLASPSSAGVTTAPPAFGAASPAQAVRDWIVQLGDGDYQSTERVVPDDQLALLAAVEGRGPDEVATMLAEGVPPAIRQNFWRSFSESFPGFAGEQVRELVVGKAEPFTLDGRRFAGVQLVFRERLGSGEIISLRDEQGRWWVDLLGTFGLALARPLEAWMQEVPSSAEGDRVRAALARHRSSLQAALERRPLGQPGEASVAALQRLIAELG